MRILTAALLLASPAMAATDPMADMPGMDHGTHAPPTAPAPLPAPVPPAPAPTPAPAGGPHAGHDMAAMPGMDMGGVAHGDHAMAMTSAFGPYAMTRDASGTSWQPDAGGHGGIHVAAGGWMLMGHALLNLAYDSQSGPRGADKAFLGGMVMGMAQRPLWDGATLQLRAMLSPEPLMGKAGYPLLLATGETADGATPLIDRQHPHDLFMKLSASLSQRVGDRSSIFVYFGLPGEPAFGPPAFMHRQSILDSPEAPISHHWLDSTHITFGVLTAGVVIGDVKLEASRFNGREPDQHRYDIETPRFNSTAARISWNPGREWSLQASWARQKSPEQLSPDEDEERWSASAIYTTPLKGGGSWSTTAAWGRRIGIEPDGHRDAALDAFILESSLKPDDRWTVFARAEMVDNNELAPPPGAVHGPIDTVGKASLGIIRDFRLAAQVKFGIGALAAYNAVPARLDALYGGDRLGGMVFLRLKVE